MSTCYHIHGLLCQLTNMVSLHVMTEFKRTHRTSEQALAEPPFIRLNEKWMKKRMTFIVFFFEDLKKWMREIHHFTKTKISTIVAIKWSITSRTERLHSCHIFTNWFRCMLILLLITLTVCQIKLSIKLLLCSPLQVNHSCDLFKRFFYLRPKYSQTYFDHLINRRVLV